MLGLLGPQLHRFQQHPLVYIGLPVVAAIIGYVTKLIALRMMYEPIEFVGIGKVGWQGIIPKRAARMATIVVELMTDNLIDIHEIADRLDSDRLAEEIEGPLLESVDQIARQVMAEYQPGMWESLPEMAKALLIDRIQAEAPAVVASILDDVKSNIDDVFDLRRMAVTNLVKDKQLLNRIFRDVGRKEMRFIANSGIYFGFAIGVIQAVTWLFYQAPWVLPAYGLFVGYSTDWLALKMLFNPKEPKKILGITFQGLFMKRQEEVAHDYADLIADKIMTPANFYQALLEGPASDRLFQLVERNVHQVVDDQSGVARPLVVFAIGSRQYQAMKQAITDKLVAELPATLKAAEQYTAEAMDIRNTLIENIRSLTPPQFEQIIHPAFQADEWILITVGAALGFVVGLSQDLFLIHLFERIW